MFTQELFDTWGDAKLQTILDFSKRFLNGLSLDGYNFSELLLGSR